MAYTGRPPKWNRRMLGIVRKYAENSNEFGDKVPTVAGLAIQLGVSKFTLFHWAEHKTELKQLLERLNTAQENILIQLAGTKQYSDAIAKLLLARHGYVEEQRTLGQVDVSVQLTDFKRGNVKLIERKRIDETIAQRKKGGGKLESVETTQIPLSEHNDGNEIVKEHMDEHPHTIRNEAGRFISVASKGATVANENDGTLVDRVLENASKNDTL